MPILVDVQWKNEKNKMTKFNYIKWVTENKHGLLNEQHPGSGPTPPSCIPTRWPNHANWVSTWTSLPNFSSPNPNQPCNMICNKIQTWTNNLTGVGPVQANQLNCKIEEGQNQSQIHGCNC